MVRPSTPACWRISTTLCARQVLSAPPETATRMLPRGSRDRATRASQTHKAPQSSHYSQVRVFPTWNRPGFLPWCRRIPPVCVAGWAAFGTMAWSLNHQRPNNLRRTLGGFDDTNPTLGLMMGSGNYDEPQSHNRRSGSSAMHPRRMVATIVFGVETATLALILLCAYLRIAGLGQRQLAACEIARDEAWPATNSGGHDTYRRWPFPGERASRPALYSGLGRQVTPDFAWWHIFAAWDRPASGGAYHRRF